MTGWFMALFYPSSPTSWIPEANGSPTASIMLDVLEIGKPQKKQKNLLVFFEELNGCGISGMSHLCARTAWMESETKFSWRIPISTNLCIFGLKSNYMQHVGRQEGEKKADKNNFIAWNEKVSSNLSMYYISLCYYIYITSVYIYIYHYTLPKKRGSWSVPQGTSHAAQAPTRCACRSPENLWAACFARAELHLPSSRTKASGQGGRGSDETLETYGYYMVNDG